MSSSSNIGKLEKVSLRELWKHEEKGFSVWLENNIEILSEELNMPLTVIQREKRVGSFQVDLTAEDNNGNLVIIENQLEPTNHDHLGKVLTYLTNLDAKTAIWITSNPRPEHIKTVAWLNEMTPVDISFYLVHLEAYRIGNSDSAPLFAVIVEPSEETKSLGQEKKELAESKILRLKFWDQLLSRAKEKGVTLHANRSPSKENWLSAGAGKSGLGFNYVAWLEEKTAVELYIDTGDRDENKRIFDFLYSNKEEIESNFGDALEWQRLENARASRVRYTLKGGGLKDDNKWTSIQDATIDAMDRFSKALKPHIRNL